MLARVDDGPSPGLSWRSTHGAVLEIQMKTIETEIEIRATPAHVWRILTDLPDHSQWNPFITSISGSLKVGRKISVRIRPPGKRAMSFKPTLLIVEPERELRWKGKVLAPGLFDGEHYFRLTPTGSGTRFTQGERFSGLLVPFMGSAFGPTEAGFTAMNESLKRRAESKSFELNQER
jgi:hypothetical protein